MVEARRKELPTQIPFDAQLIASVLGGRAERPSPKVIAELAEVGIDLKHDDVWEVFLFNPLTKIEGYLWLYPHWREVTFHTRVQIEVQPVKHDVKVVDDQVFLNIEKAEGNLQIQDTGLGFLKVTYVNNILVAKAFGRVRFEGFTADLDVYHDCQHNFVTK